MKRVDRPIALAVVVLAVVGCCVLPIRIPHTVTVSGRVLCARELVITADPTGAIVTSVVDHEHGATPSYSAAQFARGDAVSFTLEPHATAGTVVARGDTLGVFRSSEVERELERLRGEVDNARATLQVTATGEKTSVVEEARQEVVRARRQAEDQALILARQKYLYEHDLISQQEYELAERKASLSTIDVSIAEARLHSATTGAKSEDVALIRTKIASLQREISVLECRSRGSTLVSPLSGVVTQVATGETLLVVSDTTDYVVVMPVPLSERDAVAPRETVRLTATDVGPIPSAVVTRLDQTIQLLNGQQVVVVTARLARGAAMSLRGLVTRCAIQCVAESPLSTLRRATRRTLR